MNVLITGGAGFIGSNLANHLLGAGHKVSVFDNLSRKGTEHNLEWLQAHDQNKSLRFIKGDVRDWDAVQAAIRDVDVVYHLAAQVAVTTSVNDPRTDFEVNALGTLNVLEAARLSERKPIVVFTSTNKVYGGMEDVVVVEDDTRYGYRDYPQGISESQPLDFHSPYGCSKGAADQYVRDYARIYGLRTVVFRMSCIYGTRQFGNEDQGWLAHFIIASVLGRPITIYGDGKQVRDMLFVDDLIRAFEAVVTHIDVAAGQVFNIGGGSINTLAVWSELAPLLEQLLGKKIDVNYRDWRPGDQAVYVSDIRKAEKVLGWSPQVPVREGIKCLHDWVVAKRDILQE